MWLSGSLSNHKICHWFRRIFQSCFKILSLIQTPKPNPEEGSNLYFVPFLIIAGHSSVMSVLNPLTKQSPHRPTTHPPCLLILKISYGPAACSFTYIEINFTDIHTLPLVCHLVVQGTHIEPALWNELVRVWLWGFCIRFFLGCAANGQLISKSRLACRRFSQKPNGRIWFVWHEE